MVSHVIMLHDMFYLLHSEYWTLAKMKNKKPAAAWFPPQSSLLKGDLNILGDKLWFCKRWLWIRLWDVMSGSAPLNMHDPMARWHSPIAGESMLRGANAMRDSNDG